MGGDDLAKPDDDPVFGRPRSRVPLRTVISTNVRLKQVPVPGVEVYRHAGRGGVGKSNAVEHVWIRVELTSLRANPRRTRGTSFGRVPSMTSHSS